MPCLRSFSVKFLFYILFYIMYARVWEPDMYHRQSFPRLGDYIATVLQVTRLTKSIIRVSGGIGSDTYNSFKKARTCTLAFTIVW